MDVIPQEELRNQVSEVLRRVEDGESLIVTVAGRPVAELRPAARRRWISGEALQTVFRDPTPQTLARDLEAFGGEVADPYLA